MKRLCTALLGLAFTAATASAHAAGGWTNNLTVDRIAPRPDADKIFFTVTGSNYLHTCESNGVNYLELKISADPDKVVYSALLTLFTTGKQGTFYVDQGCNAKYIESCGASSCAPF